jgi:hypothetical protein
MTAVRVIIKGNDNTIQTYRTTNIDHAVWHLTSRDLTSLGAVDKLFKYYPEIEVPKLSGKPHCHLVR